MPLTERKSILNTILVVHHRHHQIPAHQSKRELLHGLRFRVAFLNTSSTCPRVGIGISIPARDFCFGSTGPASSSSTEGRLRSLVIRWSSNSLCFTNCSLDNKSAN